MTISGVPTLPLQFNGNGSTDTFSVSFDFANEDHIIVTHIAGDGTQTVMTQDAEGDFGYVIEETDVGSGDYQVVCNTAPATGSQLHINRTTPLTQETDFQQGRQYNPQRVEDALDKLTMMAQESDIANGSAAAAATDAAAAAASAEAALESATAAAVSAATIEDRVYVPDSSEADQGVASAGGTSTIKDFVDLLGVKNGTIKLTHDLSNASTVYTLTTDETIPANIKFVMEHGARIDGAGTLTVQGEFEASEDYDSGTATITVASTKGKVLGRVNTDSLQIGGVAAVSSATLTAGGDFSGSDNVFIARAGKIVTMIWEEMSHASAAFAYSAAGIIPSSMRPAIITRNAFRGQGTVINNITIEPSGRFHIWYADMSTGASTAQTTTQYGSVSWVVP